MSKAMDSGIRRNDEFVENFGQVYIDEFIPVFYY